LRSSKLSDTNIGGIAINDAGQTVGIVNAIEGSEATILPAALVESAAKRVLERQASVPRPWLGIRGESLLQLDQLIHRGWQLDKATSLFEDHRGILLTSVAPGSPAALATLRAGDVLLRVNDDEVKNADDLSWFLEEAKPGSSVRFTVARPEQLATQAVEVKLSESPDPFRSLAMPEVRAARMAAAGSVLGLLFEQGIETIAMRPRVASRFGAEGGLLIVYVQPASPAFKSGLRSGDVIEAIDGQPISFSSKLIPKSDTPVTNYSFSIVRNKEKLTIKLATSAK
jgi:serine protease Do